MDDNFFSKLDEDLTNLGSDKEWERTIGGHKFIFSPITFKERLKVNDTLSNAELGSLVLFETKRITISFAIRGIDGNKFYDLAKSGTKFYTKNRSGQSIEVSVSDWLYDKMGGWDDQLVMDCFSVYADLMTGHAADNVKNIEFTNTKTSYEEMAELVEQANEARTRLGLPVLIDPLDSRSELPEEPVSEPAKRELQTRKEPSPDEYGPHSPFAPIKRETREEKVPEVPEVPATETSPTAPFSPRARTSDDDDPTLIKKSQPLSAPVIDPSSRNLNPRFSPSRG